MTHEWSRFGFYRVAAAVPPVYVGDPAANAEAIAALWRQAADRQVAVVAFPELAVTGYSCEDLFGNSGLLERVRDALAELVLLSRELATAAVVGAPWSLPDGRLYNAAFVLAGGRVAGAVPKHHLANYNEYYERRWFLGGGGVDVEVEDRLLGRFRLGERQLFAIGELRFGVEVCEDLWAPLPRGIERALAGADLVVNLSASDELVAKAEYRRDLVRMVSAQGLVAYLYTSAGPWESSKDVLFGGHALIAENGHLLAEGERFRFEPALTTAEVDVAYLRHERRRHMTFATTPRPEGYHVVRLGEAPLLTTLERPVDPHPFVPADPARRDERAAEIMAIQSTGLARRLRAAGDARPVLGISGGLDSTLALLVAREAVTRLGSGPERVLAVTMPGPGTSEHTLASARELAAAAGVELREIPIDAAVAQHLRDLGHPPDRHDVVYENAQARERTQILFDLANGVGGIVVGTGDLSELALGWCTYGGDHLASYGVNAGVPKTLVRHLVAWYAERRADERLAAVLQRVLATPISPELLPPGEAGEIAQRTEEILGPYEVHDFFLYHYVRLGRAPAKILALAELAFGGRYGAEALQRWWRTFAERFHRQQFKRTCLPPGVKVGSVTLSPRGDWRMPDEAVPPEPR